MLWNNPFDQVYLYASESRILLLIQRNPEIPEPGKSEITCLVSNWKYLLLSHLAKQFLASLSEAIITVAATFIRCRRYPPSPSTNLLRRDQSETRPQAQGQIVQPPKTGDVSPAGFHSRATNNLAFRTLTNKPINFIATQNSTAQHLSWRASLSDPISGFGIL